MRHLFRSILLSLVATACILNSAFTIAANSSGQADSATTATKKTKATKTTKTSEPSVAEQLQQFQQQLKQQQSQIQQQQNQIQQLQQNNSQLQQQVQQQTQALQGSVQQASQQAAAAEQGVTTLHTTVDDLATSTKANTNALLESKKAVNSLENPLAIHYKGVTITPGGWLESTFMFRTRNENADLTSNFGAVPYSDVTNYNLTEFRGSARGSRAILVAEGLAGTTKLTGYMELDFLGQAPTGNQVETNSFVPRQRQLWMQAEMKNGLTVSAGQFWSLMTTDRKGIALRSEFIPTTIEGSYVVGYTYVRQNAVRVVKNYSNKTWLGFEVANPETSQPNFSGTMNPGVVLGGFNNSANATSPNGSTLNFLAGSTNGFSTNTAPDFIGKVAFEPGYGHFELKVLGRIFRDRVVGAQTNYTAGGGLGWAAILPVKPKKVDFIFEGLVGKGIGRYGAANVSDVTVSPTGNVVPLPAVHALAGLEFHPQPKLDVFVYGGDEYIGKAVYNHYSEGKFVAGGYGSHLVNNTYCDVESAPSTAPACGAQNKNLYDVTGGFWYRIFKGSFGTLQYGAQYEYIRRITWAGVGGAPQGFDNVFLTSMRFYLP
jgi:hypothetical protein